MTKKSKALLFIFSIIFVVLSGIAFGVAIFNGFDPFKSNEVIIIDAAKISAPVDIKKTPHQLSGLCERELLDEYRLKYKYNPSIKYKIEIYNAVGFGELKGGIWCKIDYTEKSFHENNNAVSEERKILNFKISEEVVYEVEVVSDEVFEIEMEERKKVEKLSN